MFITGQMTVSQFIIQNKSLPRVSEKGKHDLEGTNVWSLNISSIF